MLLLIVGFLIGFVIGGALLSWIVGNSIICEYIRTLKRRRRKKKENKEKKEHKEL